MRRRDALRVDVMLHVRMLRDLVARRRSRTCVSRWRDGLTRCGTPCST